MKNSSKSVSRIHDYFYILYLSFFLHFSCEQAMYTYMYSNLEMCLKFYQLFTFFMYDYALNM